SRRRHTRFSRDWSSDVCSSDLTALSAIPEVDAVSASDVNMGMGRDHARSRTMIGFGFEGRSILTDVIRVDYDYLSTMQIELLERSEERRVGKECRSRRRRKH